MFASGVAEMGQGMPSPSGQPKHPLGTQPGTQPGTPPAGAIGQQKSSQT